jgi:hypothetical protein
MSADTLATIAAFGGICAGFLMGYVAGRFREAHRRIFGRSE